MEGPLEKLAESQQSAHTPGCLPIQQYQKPELGQFRWDYPAGLQADLVRSLGRCAAAYPEFYFLLHLQLRPVADAAQGKV